MLINLTMRKENETHMKTGVSDMFLNSITSYHQNEFWALKYQIILEEEHRFTVNLS